MAASLVPTVVAAAPVLAGSRSRSIPREQVPPSRRAPPSPKKLPRSASTAATSPTPPRKASTRRFSSATLAKALTPAASRARSLLSAASDGTAGNDDSRTPSMSSDGRYVAFSSAATNLIPHRQAHRHRPPSSATTTRHARSISATRASAPANSCLHSVYATRLHRSDGRTRRHGGHPALGQRLRTLRRVPRGDAEPRNFAPPRNRAHRRNPPPSITPTAATARSSSATRASAQHSCTPKTTRISLQPGDNLHHRRKTRRSRSERQLRARRRPGSPPPPLPSSPTPSPSTIASS